MGTCKKCNKTVLDGQKICLQCKQKRKERNKKIMNGAGAVLSVILMIATKGKFKGK